MMSSSSKGVRSCSREHKAISVDPTRVLRIESHELVEEDMCNWRHAHRGARMARVRFEGGIDLDER